MVSTVRGYVTDVPYTRGFYRELVPAWLDFVATLSGVGPPARSEGFTWCDLGCGQGVTTVVMAATHPRGHFVGIDVLPEHIDPRAALRGEGRRRERYLLGCRFHCCRS